MMKPAEADRFVEGASAYIHIPFCSAVCPYCDFAVVAGQDQLASRYVDAVCAEIEAADRWRPLDAIFFGGGTPSHVDPALLGRIVEALEARHGMADGVELSLEANPEDFSVERAGQLREIGFNRVSFGAQSFDNTVLASLGRRHLASHIEDSVGAAREAGFDNVSVDLIYGTPDETNQSWEQSVRRTVALAPDHISCYALTVERGTPLGRAVSAGAKAPDPDVQADRFETADRILTSNEFRRYEVSNWSRSGRECRYNLIVWAQGEYQAYGNGAHGFRDGRRYRNVRRVDTYIERVESGVSPRVGHDTMTRWEAELDRLFVGLRRTVGVAQGPGTDTFLASDEGKALVDAGVLGVGSERLRVIRPLLTDAVHRSLLALEGPIVRVDSDA